MLNKQLTGRQILLWSIAAVSAPLAIYAGGSSWEWTLLAGLICTAAVLATLKYGDGNYGIILRAGQLIVIAMAAGTFAKDISPCWGQRELAMPLTMIVLAALCAMGGAERAGRVSCVIVWIIAIIYIVVLSAGVKNMDIGRLKPDGEGQLMLLPSFLVPAVILILPLDQGKRLCWLGISALFGTVISIWCAATLTRQGVQLVEIPFYEYSKSLNLLGVAERFEALASVALTLGMFCLLSLLLSAAENLVRNGSIIGGIGAAYVASSISIGAAEMSVITTVFWLIVPLINGVKNNRKNMKKVLDKNEPK